MNVSIQTRFLLSYIGVICISVFLLLTAGFLVLFTITGDVKSVKYFYKNSYTNKPLTAAEENTFLDLKLLAKHAPDQLLDEKQLQGKEDVEIVVRKGTAITYASPELERKTLQQSLPTFESANINTRDTIQVNNTFYTYVKFDFYFSNQEEGSIFVLRKVSSYAELARKLFPILFALLLLLLVVTLGFLNYVVSRSIIKPITMLKHGIERMKAGDLNFQLHTCSNDEVGQLTQSFEEMRKKLKESIEIQVQYEENRKELLSNISHDLKTPITSIIGYVEGIRDGVANTPEKVDKYLTTVYTKAKDLNAIIDELFLFSKLDLQREPFTFESVDLLQYLKDYIEELHLDLGDQGIEVLFSSSRTHPSYVKADRDKLKRVLSNLVNNSVKYMDKESKQIIISLLDEESTVTVQVTDNGSGISSTALPFIFERFYRVEQSRNKRTGGSGLGLAIAKQIIQGHGGSISAVSEIGEGTTVFFSLLKVKRSGEIR